MDLYDKYADPQMPILLINGDLDPQTNVEQARDAAINFGANTKGINRYYVEFPNVRHGVLTSSPIINDTDYSNRFRRDYKSCGMYVIKSFIDNPYSQPDTTCLNWLVPLDWSVSTNITKSKSKEIIGTENAWGEIVDIPTTTEPTTDPDGAYTHCVYNSAATVLSLLMIGIYFSF